MKTEAEQVREEVEKAAQTIVEMNAKDDEAWAAFVGANAQNLHTLHPTFSIQILEQRIGFRAQEIRGHLIAEARRFERDLVDRAKLVHAGEQRFNDAVAAIELAYPRKKWSEIQMRLSNTIHDMGAQEA